MKFHAVSVFVSFAVLLAPTPGEAQQPKFPEEQKTFLEAIAKKDREGVSRLISEGAALNPPCLGPNHKCHPLVIAVEQSSLEVIQLLLESGADPNVENPYGRRALHYALAAERPDRTPVIEALILRNADPNAPNDFGITPFMEAAFLGDRYVVEMMLNNGAKVNFTAVSRNSGSVPSNTTALMQAAGNCHTEIMKLLISRGADIRQKNSWGMSAAGYVKRFCKDSSQRTKAASLLAAPPP